MALIVGIALCAIVGGSIVFMVARERSNQQAGGAFCVLGVALLVVAQLSLST